MELWILENKK